MKKLYYLLITLMGVCMVACGNDDGVDNSQPKPEVPKPYKITLSQQTIEVGFEPDTYSVNVTSPYSWDAVSKNDWIVVDSPTGIAGTEQLTFSIARNEDEKVRKGTIVVKNSDYNLITEFYITQAAFVPEISIAPKTLNFSIDGGEESIAVTANFEHSATTDADWLSITKTEEGYTLTVPEYLDVDSRTAEVVISNEKYDISEVVNITQAAFVPEISITPKTLNFSIDGGEESIAVTANFTHKATTDADWLSITKTEEGYTLTAPEYLEVDSRTAEVVISNEKYGISEIVNITQAAFVPSELSVTPKTLNFSSIGGEECVVVTANFTHKATTDADWLSITKTEEGYTLTAPEYLEVDSRTAEVVISNEKYGISEIVNITQAAFVPSELSVTPKTLNFSIAGGEESIAVTANFTHKATTDADWLSITKTDEGYTLTVPEYLEVDSRTAEVVISNEKYNISEIIQITQEGPNKKQLIYYTSNDEMIVEPYFSSAFGANIISNIYKNGIGVIVFDGEVTSIGNGAFEDCNSLTSVTIPDSVTTIGNDAFYSCDSLTSVTIPDSVTTIENDAFKYSRRLTSVYITDLSTWCKIGFSTFAANPLYDGASLYLNNELVTDLVIPSDITEIKNYAFYGCSSLTSVTIPDSVTTIGEAAFYNCSSLMEFNGKFASEDGRCLIIDGTLNSFAPAGLTEYTIPDSVTTIGNYAFAYCDSLTSVTIPDSVTTIGDYAFDDCYSLTSVTIPDSVTSIGNSAFSTCSSLTSVTIPDSVTTIGDYAFRDCSSLTSITIPDSVTTIGKYAFYDCYSLTSVTIPDSVTSIGYAAFKDCSSLTSITIGSSVTSIGSSAFSGCSSLTSVYCKATTPPDVGSNMFYNNAYSRRIYVPTESVEAYKSASYWSNYKSSIVGYDF